MTGPGTELIARADLAAKCRSCGTCRSVCPVFAEVGSEGSVARGKVALIKAVLEGELDLTEIFDDRIQLCLNCKSCVAICPNSTRVDDLILSARSGLVEAGRLPFVRRMVFRFMLRRGRLLPPFGRFASFMQRWVLRGLPPESPLRAFLPLVGVERDRVFPDFAPRSFLSQAPDVAPAVGSDAAGTAARGADVDERWRIARSAKRVAYFVGCASNLIYPETARATVQALTQAGVEIVIPKGQSCCSTPVMNAGDFVTSREMARRNIGVLRATGADAVVTGCASCGLTLKREYAELLGIDGGVGLPVFDFTEFLALRSACAGPHGAATSPLGCEASQVRGGAAERSSEECSRVRVTYHDPCHLVRGQELSEEPRELLRSLPWVEFVEMRDADRCCGSGGTFSLSHYDIAKRIGARKVEAIREAGVDVVATECPSCVMQLRDMLAQAGLEVAVVSVADVLAQRD